VGLRLGRDDDHDPFRPRLPCRIQHPVDDAAAEEWMQVLRYRGFHPRAEACGHHHRCQLGVVRAQGRVGWGARIRTWDRGTKTRCLTTWLRPIDGPKSIAGLLLGGAAGTVGVEE